MRTDEEMRINRKIAHARNECGNPKDYAAGTTEFLLLLKEISADRRIKIEKTYHDTFSLAIYQLRKVEKYGPSWEMKIIEINNASTIQIVVSKAWQKLYELKLQLQCIADKKAK